MSAGRDGTGAGRALGARPAGARSAGPSPATGAAPAGSARPVPAGSWGSRRLLPAARRSLGLRRAPPDGAGAAEVGREGGEKRARLGESTEASGSDEPDVTVGSAQPQLLALSAVVLPASGLGQAAFLSARSAACWRWGAPREPDGSAPAALSVCRHNLVRPQLAGGEQRLPAPNAFVGVCELLPGE